MSQTPSRRPWKHHGTTILRSGDSDKTKKRLPISLDLRHCELALNVNCNTMSLTTRTASISRATNETKIQISLSLDGGVLPPYEPSTHFPAPTDPQEAEAAKKGILPNKDAKHATQFTPTQQITISTGIGFLDHMLHALAKHGGMSLAVRAKGDLYSMSISL